LDLQSKSNTKWIYNPLFTMPNIKVNVLKGIDVFRIVNAYGNIVRLAKRTSCISLNQPKLPRLLVCFVQIIFKVLVVGVNS
jgi:hypothetical protein